MKEIGDKLKETRESMGISLEEAAEDLKLRPSQIENIEAGNIEAFKDVFYLKYFIRDYSKYLGLKYEDMVNEFNEFLFDYTSKISIKDIKEAQKQKSTKKEELKRISSPYTTSTEKNYNFVPLMYILVIIVVFVVGYFIYNNFFKKEEIDNPIEAIYIRRSYEFTK